METPEYGKRFIPTKEPSKLIYDDNGLIIDPEDETPLSGILISGDGYTPVVNGLAGELIPFQGKQTANNTIK